MKIDPNAPAFPYEFTAQTGITIRAHFAMTFTAALLASPKPINNKQAVTEREYVDFGITVADTLIAALNSEVK